MAKCTHFDTVYSSVSDNLTKLKFPVWVKETYSPITMFRVDEHGNREFVAPIRPVDEFNADSPCRANYSVRTIVDVIVNGHWIEFVNGGDIEVIHGWLKDYISVMDKTGADLKNDVFYQNAKLVIAKLEGNISGRNQWEAIKHPKKLSIEAILSAL